MIRLKKTYSGYTRGYTDSRIQTAVSHGWGRPQVAALARAASSSIATPRDNSQIPHKQKKNEIYTQMHTYRTNLPKIRASIYGVAQAKPGKGSLFTELKKRTYS